MGIADVVAVFEELGGCGAVGIELEHPRRPPLGIEEHLAQPGAVPQAFPRAAVGRCVGHHLHAATLGEPVERRAGRVEPAVEAVEQVQQAVGEFVLHAAAGDLPDLRALLAMADEHAVDEGVVHVAGEDGVAARRA